MTHYSKVLVGLTAIIFVLPAMLYAHGVKGEIDVGAVVITAQYDTGETMSYAKVAILAPGMELPFQSGRTDKNGRFSFSPDMPGDWKVTVDDEMGHRLEINVPVDEHLALSAKHQATSSTHCKYPSALMGICIIFGVLGLVFWWKGKGERRKG